MIHHAPSRSQLGQTEGTWAASARSRQALRLRGRRARETRGGASPAAIYFSVLTSKKKLADDRLSCGPPSAMLPRRLPSSQERSRPAFNEPPAQPRRRCVASGNLFLRSQVPKKSRKRSPWGRRGSRLHASPSAYKPRASKLALSAPPPPCRRRCVASGNLFLPLQTPPPKKHLPTTLWWRKASLLHASPSACQPRASKLALSAPPSARNRRCAFLIPKGRNRMPLATQRLSVACNRQVIEGRCVASGNLFLHSQIQKKKHSSFTRRPSGGTSASRASKLALSAPP